MLMFTVVWPLTPFACLVVSSLEQRAAAVRRHTAGPPRNRRAAAAQPPRGRAARPPRDRRATAARPPQVRLAISCRRPVAHRCNGLGTGNAWSGVLTCLAWVSVPINCGMISLATPQLDVYFERPLEPFQRLLLAVV